MNRSSSTSLPYRTPPALQAEIARLQKSGVDAVFEFTSEQSLKDSTQEIAGAGQGGLGLQTLSYYVDEDDHSKQLRTGYVQHMTNMFKLAGDSDAAAAAEAKTVMDIETTLAKASKKREDLRDPYANFHVMTLDQLHTLTPHISWKNYFQETGAPSAGFGGYRPAGVLPGLDAAMSLPSRSTIGRFTCAGT